MKYFTPDLYVRFQSTDDAVADAVDEEWEQAAAAYRRRITEISTALPSAARDLIEHHYLHDARVLSLARNAQTLVIMLQLDPPPHERLILIYELDGDPRIETAALPRELTSRQIEWMYDEMDLIPDSPSFSHEILLSNGWCVFVGFRAIQVVSVAEMLPDGQASGRRGESSLARTA